MIVVMKLDTAILMELITFEKNEVIPFQISTKNCLIFVQVSSHVVPNQPHTVSNMPRSMFPRDCRIPTNPFQIPTNISFIPFQHCSQLPVKIPINTSSIPVNTSRTVPSTLEIISNAASNIGANTEQKPSQIAFTTSPKFSKSKPRAFSLSTMP